MQLRRYRVHTAIRGVYASDKLKGFVSIPPGASLLEIGDRDAASLYVSVQWKNRNLLVFPRDLADRAVEEHIRPENAA
jgi:hypothetical protein